jgi:hypothetical protein
LYTNIDDSETGKEVEGSLSQFVRMSLNFLAAFTPTMFVMKMINMNAALSRLSENGSKPGTKAIKY